MDIWEGEAMRLTGEEAWLIETMRSKGQEQLGPYARLVTGGLYAACMGLWMGDNALFRAGGWTGIAPDANRILEIVSEQVGDIVPDDILEAQEKGDLYPLEGLRPDVQLALFMRQLLQRERARMVRVAPGSRNPNPNQAKS